MSACGDCHEREASVHVTQVEGEQVVTVHLCGQCAAARGIAGEAPAEGSPLGSFLAALGPAITTPTAEANATATCPSCGASLADVRATGRLGCAVCWETFARSLRDLLRRLHGATRHVGEWYDDPAVEDAGPRRAIYERLRLQDALDRAVELEAFEQAAELRDQLRALTEDERP
jgi:protein arginine kinase activator